MADFDEKTELSAAKERLLKAIQVETVAPSADARNFAEAYAHLVNAESVAAKITPPPPEATP